MSMLDTEILRCEDLFTVEKVLHLFGASVPADAQVALYSKIKTLPKRRTQNWHLLNAPWAPSKHTQKTQSAKWKMLLSRLWCA